jgi:hypothetical protein
MENAKYFHFNTVFTTKSQGNSHVSVFPFRVEHHAFASLHHACPMHSMKHAD